MKNSEPIKIMIVDDHDLFREGLKYILSKAPEFQIAGDASNGVEYLEKLQSIKPDIVLMDIDMPRMNGFEATRQSLEIYPDLKIITLSMHGDQGHYQRMIELGVKGFVLKDSGISQLKNAISEVYQGRNYFSQELLMSIILKKVQSPQGEQLRLKLDISARELEVLQYICKACTNKQIADSLYISPKTVEGHKAKLMEKTNSSNSVSLVLFAIKNHLVEI
jgi:DNA-binding NarL/FixJ family response regulator